MRARRFSLPLSAWPATLLFASLSALSPLGMDSYLPAVEHFAASLGVSSKQASWTLSNFLIGLGLGQLVGGAFSDQLGRRPLAIAGLLLYIVSCFVIALKESLFIASLFRLFQGAGGGIMMVCGIAMLKDTTLPERLAERLALAVFIVTIMPVVAPIIGSIILLFAPWPVIFMVCGAAAGLLLIVVLILVPETHRQRGGSWSVVQALRQYRYIILFKTDGKYIALVHTFSICFGSSIILVFVTNAPSMLLTYYGLNSQQFPLAFGVVILAMLSGNRIGRILLRRMSPQRLFVKGVFFQVFCVSALFVLCLFVPKPSLFLLLPGIMLGAGTFSAMGPAAQAIYLNLFDRYYGSATALENALRFAWGGFWGGVAVSLPLRPELAMVTVLFVGILLSLLCLSYTRSHWLPGQRLL